MTFKGGVHPSENKEMSLGSPVEPYLPKGELIFPLNQHIGKPAEPVVAKGDHVLAGQLIGQASGFISANIVSSVSGTVKAIEPRMTVMGVKANAIVIESDGQFTPAEGVGTPRKLESYSDEEIIEAVKNAGIVGMGGAGFPTNVKLMPKNPSDIEFIIANGCECEPYITCDDRLMQDHGRDIVDGIKIIMQLFPNARGIVAIEENKPQAIKIMEGICASEKGIEVQVVKTKYPQGGERNLISVVAGRDIKAGQLPAEVGCVVSNVASLKAISDAVLRSTPLMERYVTITGSAVAAPKTMIVKIGTNLNELLDACGGVKSGVTAKKALCGGPMMGIAMGDINVGLCKNNNAMTVLAEDEVEEAEAIMTNCIRCGRCAKACPIHLVPQMLAIAAERGDLDSYENKLYGLDCFQCGSCTYVCPAKRPLMQLFKATRATILANKRK